MIDKIPEFLLKRFSLRTSIASKFPDDIKQFMFDYANYYGWDLSRLTSNRNTPLQCIYLYMSRNYTTLPKCEYPGCDNSVYFTHGANLTRGCCYNHSQKISVFEKYSVWNVADLPSVKEKKKITCLEKYGETTNLKCSETKEKSKVTNLRKYGVLYPMQLEESRRKRKITFMENYGTDEITKSDHFKKKFKLTMFEKYGCENAMQNSEIFDKMQKTSFLSKEYIWKTGEISLVQGYEPIVLKELEDSGYTFEMIKTTPKDMPCIWYYFKGKKKKYIPDFYIPSENLIIEVKSDYTLNKEFEMNQAKFQAVKDLGFNFKLEVR